MIGLLIFIALVPTAAFIALQVPWIQTWAAKKAVAKVEQYIDGKAAIDRLIIVFYNRIYLEGVSIVGTQGDTLGSIHKLSVNISANNLAMGKIKINRISIEGGEFNYIEEGENKESNISRIFKIDSSPKTGKKGGIPNISANEVRLKNFRFRYVASKKPTHPVDPQCMDYTDIDVRNINARLNRVSVKDGAITCRIQKLACTEKCGLDLRELKGDFSMDRHLTILENMTLTDAFSSINAKYLSFGYDSGKDLKDFTNKIVLGANFNSSTLDFRTIAFFTPALENSTLRMKFNGRVSGPVAEMKVEYFNVTSPGGETTINLSTSITGLPDINKTIFKGNIYNLQTNTKDISELIASFSGTEPNKKISDISPGVNYEFTGKINGSISDMFASGELSSVIGGAGFDIHMSNRGKKEGLILKGNISTADLDVGAVIDNKQLGKATINTTLSATIKEAEYGGPQIVLDSLRVSRFGFNGYDYSNLFAVGNYSQKKFDGRILCHDPNLHFMLQGVFSLSDITKNSVYNFYADISFADLAALNFDKRDAVSQISLRAVANLSINENKNLFGNANIKNLTYWNSTGEYDIGSIGLKSVFKNNDFNINLDAPFLTADLVGTESPMVFINRLTDIILYDHFGDVFIKKEKKEDNSPKGKTKVSLRTYNMKSICSLVSPKLYIADSTTVNLSLDERDSLDLSLYSHRIGFNANSIKGIELHLTNPDSLIHATINSSAINFGSINIDNNKINLLVDGDVIDMKYIFANEGDIKNELEFSSDIFFNRDNAGELRTNISINQSELFLKGYKWNFMPCNISIGKKAYTLKGFSLYNNEQEIKADGTVSTDILDTLKLDLHNFDLSIVNSFLSNDLNIKGFFTGNATIMDLFGDPNIFMDLHGHDVSLFENPVGSLQIMSKWDQSKKRINLFINNKYLNESPLNISGYYQPSGKFLNLNVSLADFALTYIEPFLGDIICNTSGSISGDMELIGTLDKLNLTSYNSRFDNFKFTPVFTQVPYTLNGPVEMSETSITFMGLELKDQYGKTAVLDGGLSHRFFKDMYLDTKLTFEDLQCLNTTEKNNSTFYGSAYGTGSINISGPLNDLFMDVNFATAGNTSIHVPLSSAASATNKDLLSFVENEVVVDPYESEFLPPLKKKKSKTKFELRAKANITSNTELFIEINKQLGDILKCKGSGTIDVEVNPSRDILDLRGDYTIDEGSYKFVLLGLTAKNFTINNGGSIGFNGGVMNTNLNVGATYHTKASISTLIADTSAVGNRRNVDCGIHMSGPLSNPQISFSIDVPDLDPITKGRVESALSTNDKVQKQFMALIISGSFVPDEQSGIVNNTTILYSNAGEILSNQFNNVFRQLGIPLDLGLNYQPGEGKSNTMFDVALSYQAFNNRVVINGNVGNSQNSSRSWMGNFEAEVKLDKRGKMRINAFTRSADDYSNYLDNTQRNGLGFTYQDEFDDIGELFRNIFYSKKKREEYETRMLLEAEKALIKEAEDAEAKKQKVLKPKESPYRFF